MAARPRAVALCLVSLLGATALLAGPSAASHSPSDTAGRSTLEQTVIGDDQQTVDDPSDDAFSFLDSSGPGEPYVVREQLGEAKPGRRERRRSLLYLAQLSDFQLSDEESPARVEFLDKEPSGFASSAWRPQEALLPFEVDQSIRQVNRFERSPVRQGDGTRAPLANTILTGDLADSQQLNETRWVVRLLEGGRLDPGSGSTSSAAYDDQRGCPPAGPLRQPLLAEAPLYTGVQDYDDYPATDPGSGDRHYYDPSELRGDFRTNGWPQYESGMGRTIVDEAQEPFTARGLDVPSYVSLGNHDSLVQGNQWAAAEINEIALGCQKVFPFSPLEVAAGDPSLVDGLPPFTDFLTNPPVGSTQTVPADPRRRLIDDRKYRSMYDTGAQEDNHGFAYIDRAERRASDGAASYYDFSPAPGIRYIALDTVSEGGQTPQSSDGNIDDPQWRWLTEQLRKAQERDELVITFGHHATGSLTANVADEAPPQGPSQPGAPPCRDPSGDDQQDTIGPGCDRDPRVSTPIHLGEDLKGLFLRFPNVIAFVAGHSHENQVTPFEGGDGAFWEIKSPAIADWTTAHRLIEVMDNRDGTLSLFGTMLDDASPSGAPPGEPQPEVGTAGHAGGFTPDDLGSIARTIAYNDSQQGPDGSEGDPNDRNVELLLRDPRLQGPGPDDDLTCRGADATIVGTDEGDEIEGTPGRDVIVALGGADEVEGLGGNDVVCGRTGRDRLLGQRGDDDMFGGNAPDRLRAGGGDDGLDGGKGRDALRGGPNDDALAGRPGRDTLLGGGGRDALEGNASRDTLKGQRSDDALRGGPRGDSLDGGSGSDACRGGFGADQQRRCET